MRVITEGKITAGDSIQRVAVGPERVTVAAVDALLYLPDPEPEALRRAAAVAALSPGWQGSLRDMAIAANRSRPPAAEDPNGAWAGFRRMRVLDRVQETDSVVSFTLGSAEPGTLPHALPGQYLTVRVPDPNIAVRNYSLSGPMTPDTYRISVKREPGGAVSNYLHDSLQRGAALEALATRGEFVLDDATAPVVLISAGIGITPVLAMLHELARTRSERQVWWIHAARRPDQHPFARESYGLLAALPRAHAVTFYSDEATAEVDDSIRAAPAVGGRLTAGRLAQIGLPQDAVAYVCGPPAFISDVTDGLQRSGLDPRRIQSELFGSRSPINPGVVETDRPRPHLPDGPPGSGPIITFVRSGIAAPFDERVTSLLEFAEACDIPTRWACRSGVCQTCETPVLGGQVDYAPRPLSGPRESTALICCAKPRTDLVLDM
ncbi:MAG: hypothetical protein ABS81_20345 [Pseudonocardia sp. SCN 72-86]|nr:MAG: hypothetical protein ABS81_20345 [Pseudonocardia sp. SCN 72-86]